MVRNSDNENNMAMNYRMKSARVLRGWTQRQLGEQVGLKEIDVSRLETGRVAPDRGMKEKIAAVLGKPAFELFLS